MSKIVVGMSGGVDSSVCAYLLKKAGHEIIGFFMRNWDSVLNNDFLGNKDAFAEKCVQEQDYLDAKKVASQLEIPFYQTNFVDEYWNQVFKKLIDDYQKGYTPNPDVLCNKYIKFDSFLNEAKKRFQFDYLAMGHYAKVDKEGYLYVPKDLNKDQTYFLAQLKRSQLQNILFPLADLEKKEVRKIAKKMNLITANKKDSTGICFIGERKFTDFLKNYIPSKPGDIIDITTKKIVGKHTGAMYYTVGQRKGLHLGGMSEPFYVVGHNLAKKIIYVAPISDRNYLLSDQCLLVEVNWINEKIASNKTEFLMAKMRYRQKAVSVKIEWTKPNLTVQFLQPLEAVTPGQYCVFYQNNQCVGSGRIHNVFYQNEKRVFLN